MQDNDLITRLIEIFKKINYWLLIIPMIALVGMFFIDAANVVTIQFFKFRATPSQKETIEELTVIVSYMALAYILLVPGHIKTDMFINRFGTRLRFIADMIADTATLAVAGFCSWTLTMTTIHTITFGSTRAADFQIPLSPVYALMTIAFVFFAIAALLKMLDHIRCFREKCRRELNAEQAVPRDL